MTIFCDNTPISVRPIKSAHINLPTPCKVVLYEHLGLKPNVNGNYFVSVMYLNGDEFEVKQIYKYYILRNAIVDYLDIILKLC